MSNRLEGKNIIVDCKVSLDNWTQFINEKDPKERDKQLTKHIDSVKDHIKKLSNKNYNKLYNLKFKKVLNIETYNDEVNTYEIRDEKNIYSFPFFLIFSHCSFDNKTGIWKNDEEITLSTQKKNEENVKWKKVFNESVVSAPKTTTLGLSCPT